MLRRAKCTNTEQHRHVFVLLKAATALQMFLNGIPVQVGSSLLPLSLLFIFPCGIFIFFNFLIPICNSDPGAYSVFLLGGRACRKAWYCTWKRDFWQSHTPTSRNALDHSWIFLCCSGTYGLCHTKSKAWPSMRVYHWVLFFSRLDNGLCADLSLLFLFFSLSLHVTKAIL